jgi:hypothetical protein
MATLILVTPILTRRMLKHIPCPALAAIEGKRPHPMCGWRDVRLMFIFREKRRRFVAQSRNRSESFAAWGTAAQRTH